MEIGKRGGDLEGTEGNVMVQWRITGGNRMESVLLFFFEYHQGVPPVSHCRLILGVVKEYRIAEYLLN